MKRDFSYGSLGYSFLHALKLTTLIFSVIGLISLLVIFSERGNLVPSIILTFIGTVAAFTYYINKI